MLEYGKVRVAREALIGWRDLPEPERTQILEKLTRLAEVSPGRWPADEVKPINGRPGEYLLHGPGEFRIAFRLTPEGITVVGIVLQGTLDWLNAG